MLSNTYLKKSAAAALKDNDETCTAMLKFKPASEAELKALGTVPEGYVAGWASTPDLDSYKHVVATGAFTKAIQERGLTGPRSIKLLVGHSWQQVAGVIKVLEYRGDSLWIEAQLNLKLSFAADAYEQCKMLGGLNFSVGFMLKEYTWDTDDTTEQEFLHIKRGDLFEVSIVAFPGNEAATMEFVKSAEKNNAPAKTVSAFEKQLVSLGLAKNRSDAHRITLEVKKSLQLFQTETPESEDEDVTVTPPPLLDKAKIDALGELVAKMKQTLLSS